MLKNIVCYDKLFIVLRRGETVAKVKQYSGKKSLLSRIFKDNSKYDVQNKELFWYGLGVAGQNHTYNLVAGWFEYFCNFVLFIKPMHTGIVLGIMRGWDAVNDPLAGAIIDGRTPKSGDKLKPYLKIFAIPIGIMACLMFVNWGFSSYVAKIAYVASIYFLWDTFYSFQDTAQWGMVARISNMPERREKAAYVGRIGGMFGGLIPGLITTVVGLVLDGILPITLTQLFIMLGIVFGLGGMLLTLVFTNIKERVPNLPPEKKMLGGFRLLKHNKIVLLIAFGSVLNVCMLNISQINFFQTMVRVEIGGKVLNGATILLPFTILSGLPGFFSIFFTPYFSKKFGGMKNVLVISSLANIVCRVIMFFVGYEGWRLIVVCAMHALISFPSNMCGIATTALWSDSVDYTEWKTGQRNEGTVFAMQNFLAKMTGSISSFFSGLTLTLLKFEPEKFVENPNAPLAAEFTKWAWPLYSLAPALGSVMQIIPLLILKFTPADRARIHEELEMRREAKKRDKLLVVGDYTYGESNKFLDAEINVYDYDDVVERDRELSRMLDEDYVIVLPQDDEKENKEE